MQVFMSVIICTFNRARLLRRALSSLARQTTGPDGFEVVVVDDGSDDDTAGVCREILRGFANSQYIPLGRNEGLPSARNRGIREARGEYVLFVDDDCIPERNWLEKMMEALDKEKIVAGAIESPPYSYLKLCHNIAEFHPFMPGRKKGVVDFIAGANMGFRRSVFLELGVFHEGIIPGEDMEFILRARQRGYRIYFTPDAVVTHDPDRTVLRNILAYSSEHAFISILLRNQYLHLLQTPVLLRSPFLVLAASPLIAFKVTIGIYLRNSRLWKVFWTAPMVYLLKLSWCWGAYLGLRSQRIAGGPG